MKYNRPGYKTEKCASIMAATAPQQKKGRNKQGQQRGGVTEERRRAGQGRQSNSRGNL